MIVRFAVFLVVCTLSIALLTSAFPGALGAEAKGGDKEASMRKKGGGKKKVALKKAFPTKPLEKGAKRSHAPYNQGNCSICHQKDDPKDPGPVKMATNKLCLGCHEPQRANLMSKRIVHAPVAKDCSYCHNSHNSQHRHLLYRAPKQLCGACHASIKSAFNSKSKHDAVVKKRGCKNCHASHASNARGLLLSNQYGLCIKCHGKDDVKDDKGRVLKNLKKLGEDKAFHHVPFAKKTCSECHSPHGSKNHHLLVSAYPEEFYAPFEKGTYALCFKCHKEERVAQAETIRLTGFRDGSKNLHYVHVVGQGRGRTCRSCHEDHATEHNHLIRQSVPFGSSGWTLQLNYEGTKTGGSCARTCHDTKKYNNKGIRPQDISRDYLERKKYKQAEIAAEIEKEQAERSGEINVNYARRLLKSRKIANALEQTKKALSKNDRLADAHALMGYIYAKQKKCGLAEQALTKAFELDANNRDAKKGKKLLNRLIKRKRCSVEPAPELNTANDRAPRSNNTVFSRPLRDPPQ